MDFLNLSNKTALITGVADNVGFGWHIAKTLQEAGADIVMSCHPRVSSILERFLTKDKYKDSRTLKSGGELSPKLVIPCDVSSDDSILNLKNELVKNSIEISTLVHSIAFAPEIEKDHMHVSREGYLTAMSISSYSLIALSRNLLPIFSPNGASVIALSYLAAEKAVPMYGGGMASAKAALECDSRMLSWFLGENGHRINIVSPGPYGSRAAKSVGDIDEMIKITKEKSPLRRAITPKDVANAVAFLASDLSESITGETVHVDCGFHAMAMV